MGKTQKIYKKIGKFDRNAIREYLIPSNEFNMIITLVAAPK